MAKGLTRVLEWLFVVYFASHIPITIFIDSQAIMPASFYPQVLLDLVKNYAFDMKDEMMADPSAHPWFISFVYGECLVQFPFFFVATYAFYKGSCKWIRVPGIVYAAHTATTLQAILAHVFLEDFTNSPHPGPTTMAERLRLTAFYLPYLIVPLLILAVLLFSKEYSPASAEHGAVKQRSEPAKLVESSGSSRSRKHKTR